MIEKHPRQPVVLDEKGIARFKENKVVLFLLEKWPGGLNEIAMKDFSREDREQFAQLIGYSVSGFRYLHYASDEVVASACSEVEALECLREDAEEDALANRACLRCHCTYALRDGDEPTLYCDHCAQELAAGRSQEAPPPSYILHKIDGLDRLTNVLEKLAVAQTADAEVGRKIRAMKAVFDDRNNGDEQRSAEIDERLSTASSTSWHGGRAEERKSIVKWIRNARENPHWSKAMTDIISDALERGDHLL